VLLSHLNTHTHQTSAQHNSQHTVKIVDLTDMSLADAFGSLGAAMAADASLAKKVKGVLQFDVGSESWTVDCSGGGSVHQGKAKKANCTGASSLGRCPSPARVPPRGSPFLPQLRCPRRTAWLSSPAS